MGQLYVVVFWLLWMGLPSLWIGHRHHSWVRGLIVAAIVVLAPFGLTVGLTASGGPAETDAAQFDAWVTHCVNVGAPAGYALGIAAALAWFRYRDRGSDRRPEPRSLLRDHGCSDRVVVGSCVGMRPRAGV